MEVYLGKGLMFFIDWGNSVYIFFVYMDGINVKRIVIIDLLWLNVFIIDYVIDKFFWVDAYFDYIVMVDFDGSNRYIVIDF